MGGETPYSLQGVQAELPGGVGRWEEESSLGELGGGRRRAPWGRWEVGASSRGARFPK